jgi:hypothetical protein
MLKKLYFIKVNAIGTGKAANRIAKGASRISCALKTTIKNSKTGKASP